MACLRPGPATIRTILSPIPSYKSNHRNSKYLCRQLLQRRLKVEMIADTRTESATSASSLTPVSTPVPVPVCITLVRSFLVAWIVCRLLGQFVHRDSARRPESGTKSNRADPSKPHRKLHRCRLTHALCRTCVSAPRPCCAAINKLRKLHPPHPRAPLQTGHQGRLQGWGQDRLAIS